MPAIWRPNVGRVLPDVDVEVGVTDDASSKGTKRKRAPQTKGPCEHGVKEFERVATVRLPNWPFARDDLTVWRRR